MKFAFTTNDASSLSNALCDAVSPSIAGQTWSVQNGANSLFLRRMPTLSTLWERAGDGLRLLFDEPLTIETRVFEGENGAASHVLRMGGEKWALVARFLAFGPQKPSPQLSQTANALQWSVQHDPASWRGAGGFLGLEGASLVKGAQPWSAERAPKIGVTRDDHTTRRARTSETAAFEIEWTWPDGTWRGRVDPLGAAPLDVNWTPK